MYIRTTTIALSLLMLSAQPSIAEVMKASWYGPGFQGKDMANGEPFNMNAYTVAHKTLPLGTCLKLTNLENGRIVNRVEVTDRGPYIKGRQLDVSKAVAQHLGFIGAGTAKLQAVKVDCA